MALLEEVLDYVENNKAAQEVAAAEIKNAADILEKVTKERAAVLESALTTIGCDFTTQLNPEGSATITLKLNAAPDASVVFQVTEQTENTLILTTLVAPDTSQTQVGAIALRSEALVDDLKGLILPHFAKYIVEAKDAEPTPVVPVPATKSETPEKTTGKDAEPTIPVATPATKSEAPEKTTAKTEGK